jgi:catalase
MEKRKRHLTTNQGVPVTDNQNSLTVGQRGPVLLQDVQFIEKIAHFDRERIPERVVHAKGAGAHGSFQVYKSMKAYTRAKFLQDPAKKTPVFVRFSTVTGGRGSADTVRDPRGFAVKFYTEDGNYDLVGNNLPVFFIRDAIKFPDMVHAFKGSPDTNIPSSSSAHDSFWDFISLTPESTHMITWLFSDRGTPKSYRMQEGFGVNTYVWVNPVGKAIYVKYHWKPKLGVQNLDRHEATRLAGVDPDYLTRDLHDAIARGEEVEWELNVQLMDIADELNQDFDPLDPTKTWPASIVPGIEFSADKLLQGRTFSYADTQRHRLGANYLQLAVNRSVVPVDNNQRDGTMQTGQFSGPVNYEPNSMSGGLPKEAPGKGKSRVYQLEGEVTRQKISLTNDFAQAGERYRSLSKMDREHLMDNLTADLMNISKQIQRRVIENLTKADPKLGHSVAKGLKL